jgi:hypothetical protein
VSVLVALLMGLSALVVASIFLGRKRRRPEGGKSAIAPSVKFITGREMRGPVNAKVTQLKNEKRYSDAVALLHDFISSHPDEAIPQDKARMADLMQQKGDYTGATVFFQSILDEAHAQPNELRRLGEIIIPTLRRWRSSAKRAGVAQDVRRCQELLALAEERIPIARAHGEKERIYSKLANPAMFFDYMGWAATSSADPVCKSLHRKAWKIPSQEFLDLVEQHFSSPLNECRCSCNLLEYKDLERSQYQLVNAKPLAPT